MITLDQLKIILGSSKLDLISLTNALNNTFEKYSINTNLRICHFLAQVLHESGNFTLIKENLNYSATGLVTTFHKYFINETIATPYAKNPQKIANKVYADRMGNGNELSGDGYKYIGRGLIQLTGRTNYTKLAADLGIDSINHPELLEQINYAVLSAGWFWNSNNLNTLADYGNSVGTITNITKRINGGIIGLDDRIAKFNKLQMILK